MSDGDPLDALLPPAGVTPGPWRDPFECRIGNTEAAMITLGERFGSAPTLADAQHIVTWSPDVVREVLAWARRVREHLAFGAAVGSLDEIDVGDFERDSEGLLADLGDLCNIVAERRGT